MSDREAWITFAAAAYTGWLANGDHTNEKCREYACDDADWFVTEIKKRAEAEAAEYKAELQRVINGEPAKPTPPQPDDDGWIKWEGGECPVSELAEVVVKFRSGIVSTAFPARVAVWRHYYDRADILAYRIASQAGVTK